MIQHLSITETMEQLPALLAAAANGATLLIDLSPTEAIQLVPVRQPTRRLQFGSLRGKIHMADDFDAPLEDFEEYM